MNSKTEAAETGFHGQYHRKITTYAKPVVTINPGDQYTFGIYCVASLDEEPEPEKSLTDIERKRDLFLDSVAGNLVLRTPDKTVNTLSQATPSFIILPSLLVFRFQLRSLVEGYE